MDEGYLFVRFKNGFVAVYGPVGRGVFEAMLAAPSKGQFERLVLYRLPYGIGDSLSGPEWHLVSSSWVDAVGFVDAVKDASRP